MTASESNVPDVFPISASPTPIIAPPETLEIDPILGNRIWIDTNGNGVQDPGNGSLASGEIGLNGVVVRLLNEVGEVVAETVTKNGPANTPGYYGFETLDSPPPANPDGSGFPSGYSIEVVTPDGFTFTQQDADPIEYATGESPIDSDVDPETGRVETGALNPANGSDNSIPAVGAGLVPNQTLLTQNGVIGSRVWFDRNRNGIQDPGEGGINGVVVRLFSEDGVFLEETVTALNADGQSGFYVFENLESDRVLDIASDEVLDGDRVSNDLIGEVITDGENVENAPIVEPLPTLVQPGPSYIVEFKLPRRFIFTLENADPALTSALNRTQDSNQDSDADPETGRVRTAALTNFAGGSPVQNSLDAGMFIIDQTIEGTAEDEAIYGDKFDEYILGQAGDDSLFGRAGDDVMFGGAGNDMLTGQLGNDVLRGGPGKDKLRGSRIRYEDRQEIDILQGGADADLFILGSRRNSFYLNLGDQDQAVIVDFETGEDHLQLFGSIDDYRVEVNELGSQIFRGAELIATVHQSSLGMPIDLATDAKFVG